MIASGAHIAAAGGFNPMLQPALYAQPRTPQPPAQAPQAAAVPVQGPQATPVSLTQGLPARTPRPDPGEPQTTQDGSLRWDRTILKDRSWETTGHDGTHYKFEVSPDDKTTIEIFDKAGAGNKRLGAIEVSYDSLGWSKVEFHGAEGEYLGRFRVSEVFEPGTFRLRDADDQVLAPGQGSNELKLVDAYEGGHSVVRFAEQEFNLSGQHIPQEGRWSDEQPVETLRLSGDGWSLAGEGNYRRGNLLEVSGFDPASGRDVLLSPREFRTPEELARSAAGHMLFSGQPAREVYDGFIRSGVGGYGIPGKESAALKAALDQELDRRKLNGIEAVEHAQLRNLAQEAVHTIHGQSAWGGDPAASYDEFVTSGAGGFGTEGVASPRLKQALDTALAEEGLADPAVLKKMGVKDEAMIGLLQGKKDYDGDKLIRFEGQPGAFEEDIGEISNFQVTYKTFLASGGEPDGFIDYLNRVAEQGEGKASFLVEASQGWYGETDGKPKNDGGNAWSPFEHTTVFGWHIHGDADNRNEFLSQLKLEGVHLPG